MLRLRAAWANTRNPIQKKSSRCLKKGVITIIGSYQKGRQLWISEAAEKILVTCCNLVPNMEPLTSITNTTFFSTGGRPLGAK